MARSKGQRVQALVVRAQKGEPEENVATAAQLVAQAIEHIGRLARRARLELVIEVGDYLVQTFFTGDLDLARSFKPTKAKALGMLIERAAEMDMSASELRVAVAMSVQYHALPEAVRDRLSVRQHRALLPVRDERAKSRLARRAVSEKLSGPALSELVRRDLGPAKGGRRPHGELERAIDAARRALVSAALEAALEPAKLRALEPALRTQLARHARTLRERIERITDALAQMKE